MSVSTPGLGRVHFAGSGAEAVETAIKLARTRGRTPARRHRRRLPRQDDGRPDRQRQEPLPGPVPAPAARHDPRPLRGRRGAAEPCSRTSPARGASSSSRYRARPAWSSRRPDYLAEVAALCEEFGACLCWTRSRPASAGSAPGGVRTRTAWCRTSCSSARGSAAASSPSRRPWRAPKVFTAFDRDPYLHTSTFSGAPLAMAAARGAIGRSGATTSSPAPGTSARGCCASCAASSRPHRRRGPRGARTRADARHRVRRTRPGRRPAHRTHPERSHRQPLHQLPSGPAPHPARP